MGQMYVWPIFICVYRHSRFLYISNKKRGLVETNPQQVLGTGVEPVRALLPTGF